VSAGEHSTFPELREFMKLMGSLGCRRVISTVHVTPKGSQEVREQLEDLLAK
jgi:hypothetical protein